MDYFSKEYHRPGTSPGTLSERELAGAPPLTIRLIDYDDAGFQEQELAHVEACRASLDRPDITWIHVQGRAQPEIMRSIGEMFALHPLAMEDVLNQGQRPKVEEYDGQLFLILALPQSQVDRFSVAQLSIFVGENYLITFCGSEEDPFEPLRQRLRKHSGRLRTRKVDYLLYAVLDLAIDHGFPVLEELGGIIEELEDELLARPRQATLAQLHELRRELLLLRRMLWPQREVLSFLMRGDQPLIEEGTRFYLRDCYDHTVQIMDLLENYREMAASMLDVYLSSVSNHLNDTMRVLTLIATIFIPITFVAGVYGMNFEHMPELSWQYGYWLVWGVMLAMAIGMVVYFKKKGWL